MQDYDIVVVGAGPAGATAARFLGQRGLRVLLIDKSAFPREKPCGGGISARVIQRFPYLEEDLKWIPVNWVSRVHLESPAGIPVQYVSESPLYLMVRRYEFDHLLYERARRYVETTEGLVRRLTETHDKAVVATSDGREFGAKIIIAADGANSFVARAAGLRRGGVQQQFAICMMEETPYQRLDVVDRKTMYVYYGVQGHYGYRWIFPKCDHINLGVGFQLDYYRNKLDGAPYEHHLSFIKQLAAEQVVHGTPDPATFHAFPLPITGPAPSTYADRVMLCGDAGGFVNAFTAEGIYYAMVSGECAAKVALEAVGSRDSTAHYLRRYEEIWKAEIGLELQKSVSIQRALLSDTSRIDRIVKAARRDKGLAHLLTRYATGGISYPAFLRSLIPHAFPRHLWEKAKPSLSEER